MSILVNRWEDFARITVQTHDLDPMYDFIYAAAREKGYHWACRFALHFFMFYHAGEAALAADHDEDFWPYTFLRYNNARRGTERRHYRGMKGLRATENLSAVGQPHMVWYNMQAGNYGDLVHNIKKNYFGCEIGPYFTWKAMDIMDRGLGLSIALSLKEAVKYMPDEPRKCAQAVWPGKSVGYALAAVRDVISDLPAPGCGDRNCGYAEAETVLCMMKGYFITKTHQIGDDILEKHMQFSDFPDLIKFLPPRINLNDYKRGTLESPTLPA